MSGAPKFSNLQEAFCAFREMQAKRDAQGAIWNALAHGRYRLSLVKQAMEEGRTAEAERLSLSIIRDLLDNSDAAAINARLRALLVEGDGVVIGDDRAGDDLRHAVEPDRRHAVGQPTPGLGAADAVNADLCRDGAQFGVVKGDAEPPLVPIRVNVAGAAGEQGDAKVVEHPSLSCVSQPGEEAESGSGVSPAPATPEAGR